ncbi:glyceraldehyde 3-phosphate reductase [Lactococcus hodotermopsidis]|uniref:Glyceraldehyde 3-phosphate reductase n=1 Tax=Pseudolactococcus hodotermopsidis TaxID=2709157 RepID=A0A6A0BB85_9LACT|nr:aldo/keto reductase [Lactococcus hodotermopsidis]GFH42660.1 glyceraldehyde 3-phosphate reductase [Lactococcus hodotermopsidis]
MTYQANKSRYDNMIYRSVGKSGLKLPAVSLGLWRNFGDDVPLATQKDLILTAFDLGITHFDIANNYGGGSAERNFGLIFKEELQGYRDELIVSTKAGYGMWDGPYGDGGSRKYLVSSCDASLKRLGLDYVDIFYHHRYDPETPLEETAVALDSLVRSGKAMYIGISNYSADEARNISTIFKALKTPFIINQMKYNMLEREFESTLKAATADEGIGNISFSPLAQGQLTGRYLNGIPKDSRVSRKGALTDEATFEKNLATVRALQKIAELRHQTMAELAIAWQLRDAAVTSVLVGASRVSQLQENVRALDNISFTTEELQAIDKILKENEKK